MRIIFFALALLLVGCSQPKVEVPIQQDPQWTSGQLENGVRFHLYPMDDESVSIRMFVHAGSAQETDQQKGYAHFLEHMAFNGSKNFSTNDIVKLFEKTGLTFGADMNAYTSYYETVYELDLPDNKEIETAVMWMRDIADGLSLSPNEVEKEKGVIQGEIRRSSPEHKSLEGKYYDFLVKGTQLDNIDPVGNQQSVDGATPESIRAFYQTWYQPQSTEIILTGDIDPQQAKALLDKYFGSWQQTSSAKLQNKQHTEIVLRDFTAEVGEFDAPSMSLLVERGPASIRHRGQLHEQWLDEVALQLVWNRLDAKFTEQAAPLQSLYSSPYYLNERRYALLSVSFSAPDREQAQALFSQTIASLRDHGVSAQEVERVMASFNQLATNVDHNWQQQSPVDFASQMVNVISLGESTQSKQDYKQSLDEFIQLASIEQINKTLKDLLSQDFAIVLGADDTAAIPALEKQLPELRKQVKQPGVKPLALATSVSELAQPQSSGTVANKQITDTGFTVWTLSNGVEVWFEQDSNAGDNVQFIYASEGGTAALDPSLYAASELAVAAISRSGVGEFTGSQFDAYLGRNTIEVYPFIGFSHHGIEIASPRAKLADAFNVMFNIVTNAKVDKRQVETVARERLEELKSYLETPVGQWNKSINGNSYLPDSRHRMITAPQLAMVTDVEVQKVYEQLYDFNRNNKLVVIGDIQAEELEPLLTHFIGSIPLQEAPQSSYVAGYQLQPKPRIDLPLNNEQNSFYLLRATNPNTVASSVRTAFIDDMIQRQLSKQLTSYVREELSLDYAPDAYSVSQDREPSTDWFIEAQVAPKDIEKIDQAVDKVIHDMVQGISQQDLELVAKQLSVALQPLDNDPVQRLWFYTRYLIHGYGIEALTDVDAMTKSITKQEFEQRVSQAFGEESVKTKYTLTPKP